MAYVQYSWFFLGISRNIFHSITILSCARSSLVEPELKRSITGHSGVSIYMGVRFDITRDTIRDTCQIESSHPILVRRTARNYDIHESSKNRSMKLIKYKRIEKYKITLDGRTESKISRFPFIIIIRRARSFQWCQEYFTPEILNVCGVHGLLEFES